MKKLFSVILAIVVFFITSTFAMANDTANNTTAVSPEEGNWFFLLFFGIFLVLCYTVWGSTEADSDPVKKSKIAKFLLLPTFHASLILFCIGLVGMVMKTVIEIIAG